MTFYSDLSRRTMVTSGRYVRAVGWLSRDQPFPKGAAAAKTVDRLHQFAARWRESTHDLGWGLFRGLHRCEFCGQVRMFGNFGVPAGEILYVAPEMVSHYVETHGYAPPSAFVAAVMSAPLPGTEEYTILVRQFRRLHRRAQVQRLWRAHQRRSRKRQRPARVSGDR